MKPLVISVDLPYKNPTEMTGDMLPTYDESGMIHHSWGSIGISGVFQGTTGVNQECFSILFWANEATSNVVNCET